MRVKRARNLKNKNKKRRNKKIIIILQVAMINYSILTAGAYLISPTNAAFNDIVTIKNSLHAKWEEESDGKWDKSSLEFKGEGIVEATGDTPLRIYATIQNKGKSEPMKGPVDYEVYWASNGNPKKGELVGGGVVTPLGSGISIDIYYTPTMPGSYKFKAYQRPGHPGIGELWSETIAVLEVSPSLALLIDPPAVTAADLEAVQKGTITQADLEAFLKGEITREQLDALIAENSIPLEENLEELLPDELLRKEEEGVTEGDSEDGQEDNPTNIDEDNRLEEQEEVEVESPVDQEEHLEADPIVREEDSTDGNSNEEEEQTSDATNDGDDDQPSDGESADGKHESSMEEAAESEEDNPAETTTSVEASNEETSNDDTNNDDAGDDSNNDDSSSESADSTQVMIQVLVNSLT